MPKSFEQRQQHWKTPLLRLLPLWMGKLSSALILCFQTCKMGLIIMPTSEFLGGITKVMHQVPDLRMKGGRKCSRQEK